jgi:excinuclease ABC subunit B
VRILRELRGGAFDVLVGVNLLREGLDLPEVSLVAILDADKEGFLRSAGALIQTVGRASRNLHGTVIMYADRVTDAMQRCIQETERRRTLQAEYNETHGITPQSIHKNIEEVLGSVYEADYLHVPTEVAEEPGFASREELDAELQRLEKEMHAAARALEFERAAQLRERLRHLQEHAVWA